MKAQKVTLGGCFVAGLLSASGAAVAQEATLSSARQLEVDVGSSVTYDTNVARTGAGFAAAEGLKPQDEVVTPTVNLIANLPVGLEVVFLNASAGYDYHAQNAILNRERFEADGGVAGRFAGCAVRFTGEFTHRQYDLADLTKGQSPVGTQDRKTGLLNVNCGRPIGITPFVSLGGTKLTNGGATLSQSDYDSLTTTVGIGYRRPILGQISLYGSYSTTDFPERYCQLQLNITTGAIACVAVNGPAPGVIGIKDGFRVTSGGLSYDKPIGTRIIGGASLSYTSLNPIGPNTSTFNGLTYSANLNYTASSRLALLLDFRRDFRPSYQLGSAYYLSNSYMASATYKVGTRASVTLGGTILDRAYSGAAIVTGADVTKETRRTVFGTANYELSRHLRLTLDTRNDERIADVKGLGYSETRVAFAIRASF